MFQVYIIIIIISSLFIIFLIYSLYKNKLLEMSQPLHTNFNQFIKRIDFLKEKYSDYKEVKDFYYSIADTFELPNMKEFGFGFTNETKSEYVPLFSDIANHLIKNDFVLDTKYLNNSYKTSYFESNIQIFIEYMKEREHKKYYYYKILSRDYTAYKPTEYNVEEKLRIIREIFERHQVNKKYDLSLNYPVGFININLVEK